MDLRDDNPVFPEGLITGCFHWMSAGGIFSADIGCEGRTTHAIINKDTGSINGINAGAGAGTSRGKINGNFERSVLAAIDDTRDKWATLQEFIMARYPALGKKMICAITHDKWDVCRNLV